MYIEKHCGIHFVSQIVSSLKKFLKLFTFFHPGSNCLPIDESFDRNPSPHCLQYLFYSDLEQTCLSVCQSACFFVLFFVLSVCLIFLCVSPETMNILCIRFIDLLAPSPLACRYQVFHGFAL